MLTLGVESRSMQKLDRQKMKAMREALDLTQAQAAAAASMTLTRWNDIEAGGRDNVTIETLGRIADALGCASQDLLTPAEKAPRRGRGK